MQMSLLKGASALAQELAVIRRVSAGVMQSRRSRP
ncbi:hypothetical protein SAMN05216255_4397 [Pseudomonas segetis]|uniref:Uncharacterized protein n=1 Tax=Pseudomonas segetis TaxID=298908 RepID=A0A239JLE0_9PSED|nr:hypothetical protein SAMN05216255_4397 [Pseudomonas segetis]